MIYRSSILILILLVNFISCRKKSEDKLNSAEIWKTDMIIMNSKNNMFTDNMEDHTQYLYLYSNGIARLVDSLKNGTINESESTWEIRNRNGKNIFLFGYGKESQGIKGLAYPIVVKNKTDFKMALDSINEKHVWNLKRVK